MSVRLLIHVCTLWGASPGQHEGSQPEASTATADGDTAIDREMLGPNARGMFRVAIDFPGGAKGRRRHQTPWRGTEAEANADADRLVASFAEGGHEAVSNVKAQLLSTHLEETRDDVTPQGKMGFEKFTSGFGSKMLQKMGFSGRLGKNERIAHSDIEHNYIGHNYIGHN